MLEKLGNRAVILAFAWPLFMFCILGFAVSPILQAQAHDVPFAVVTLDEGSSLPISDVNVGDELVERLLDGEGLGDMGDDSNSDAADDSSSGTIDTSSIVWTQLSSEEELRDALAANEYYGGIIIPADFTAQQMRSATGLGGAPTLQVVLNVAKNPSLAQQMGPSLKSLMLQAGISVEVEEVNDAEIGGGSMAPLMAVQMAAMPTVVMTLITSIILAVVVWPRGGQSRRVRAAAAVKQVGVGIFLAAFIAFLGLGIDVVFGGLDLPMERVYPFVFLAVGAMMAALVGLCDLALPLGVLVGLATFSLGMSCAMLAPEMLPTFWVENIYPWVPQHYMGDGIRAIVYLGAGPLDTEISYWACLYAIGAVALVLALAVPKRAKADGSPARAGHAKARGGARKMLAARAKRQGRDDATARQAESAHRRDAVAMDGEAGESKR